MKILKLNSDIYNLKSIKKAQEAYRDFAHIKIINIKEGYILIFTRFKYSEIQTIREFENYLICIENG